MAARFWPVAAPRAAPASASDPAPPRRRFVRAVTDPSSLRFPRRAHLRASAEFQAVFGEGRRVSGACFRLHVRSVSETGPVRLGVAVSKRVDKSAVGRNRVRRQAKEMFRKQRAQLPPGDYVLVAKPEAARADNAALRADLLSLFDRARTLKPVTAPGTMPSPDAPAARTSRD